MNTRGSRTSWTTAGAASALRIKEATATPRAQKQAAPSTSVTTIAGHRARAGSGTPYSRPTPTISSTSTTLSMAQCASSPRKYAQAGRDVARTRSRIPFCRRAASTMANWL
jgi:hypothetical protein